jgi:hypothetical protein
LFDAHTNFASAAVETPPSPAASGLSLSIEADKASLFPAPPFNCTVWPIGAVTTSDNSEIVRVTGIDGNVFEILREQEGTAARAIAAGDQIALTITVKTITDIESLLAGTSPNLDGGKPDSNYGGIPAIDGGYA